MDLYDPAGEKVIKATKTKTVIETDIKTQIEK